MRLIGLASAIKRNWNNKSKWRGVFNYKVAGSYHLLRHGNDGIHILDKDWDNLIILDACRFDLFSEVIPEFDISGELQKVDSQGGDSAEFLKHNFGDEHHDIAYVTANPHVKRVLEDPFHAVDNVWLDGWDDELHTVTAETMRDRAVRAAERFPNKRLIAHFMQPHSPFVGESKLTVESYNRARKQAVGETGSDEYTPDIWEQLRSGEVTEQEVYEAYRSNLVYALHEVETLLPKLSGKTVITSDHGNVFGAKAKPFPTTVYGHTKRLRIPGLIEVPWFTCSDYDQRKEITAEQPVSDSAEPDSPTVSERLQHLGYKE